MEVKLLLEYLPVRLLQSASNFIGNCQEVAAVEIRKSLHNATAFDTVVFCSVLCGWQLFPFVLRIGVHPSFFMFYYDVQWYDNGPPLKLEHALLPVDCFGTILQETKH